MGMISLSTVKNPKYGYYFIILAAITAALVHVLSKPLLEGSNNQIEINPIVMAFLIYFICGVFFTPIVKKSKINQKITRKDFSFMAIIATAEVTGLITYFYGLSSATAVNASIFSNSEIIFSLIIAMLLFRERLNIKEWGPFSMIIVGMMIIPVGTDLYVNNFEMGSLVMGDLLIILSGLIYAVDITLCKYLGERFDVRKTVQIISFVSAAITISLIVLFQIPMNLEIMQLPSILFMSIVGTGLSNLFFLLALKHIGTVRTVLLFSTSSVFGIIFSGIFLGEAITTANIISTIMVLVGTYMLRNKLGDEEEKENTISQKAVISKRKKVRQNKKSLLCHPIEGVKRKIISEGWIGAG